MDTLDDLEVLQLCLLYAEYPQTWRTNIPRSVCVILVLRSRFGKLEFWPLEVSRFVSWMKVHGGSRVPVMFAVVPVPANRSPK